MDNSRPRVALLHYSAPPIVGGVESTLAAHARLFADHGYPVKLIAGRGEAFDPRVRVEIIPLVNSIDPRVLQANRELSQGIVSDSFRALVQDIRVALGPVLAEADVCIAHNIATLHKNLALTAALYQIREDTGIRLIAWCHDFAWDDPLYAQEMHSGWPWDLLRYAWRGVKYIVVSEARGRDLSRLMGLPEDKIAIVPPGLDPLEFLSVGETTSRLVRELRLLEAAPLILMPARVTRRKNMELAVEITAGLREQGLEPKLLVMGPLGAHNPANRVYLEELRQLQNKRNLQKAVIFLQAEGTVDDRTRRDLYWLADVMLLTSQREGFGIPLLEAGLTRLPIWCSDLPAFHESAGAAANYFALDGPTASIAARLAQMLERDPRYQWKQRVLHEFAWPRIFEERIAPLLQGGDGDGRAV